MFVDPYSPVQTNYQRQQLNVLRKHQGLPPIPPMPRYIDFIESWFVWAIHIALSMALFIGLALVFHPGYESAATNYETPQMAGWQTFLLLTAPFALLITLRSRRAARLRAEYQAMLRHWEQEGCP